VEVPYYKQQTPFTCALAVLRMALASFSRETTEVELARVTGFSPKIGISMPDLAKACKIMNFDYKVMKSAQIDDIRNFLSEHLYPIVLLKANIYEKASGEHGHFVLVKDIADKNVIVNDPDRIYGKENKPVDKEIFTTAWNSSKSWLLVVKGEIR